MPFPNNLTYNNHHFTRMDQGLELLDHNLLWGGRPPKEADKVPKEIGDLIILSAIKKETPKTKQPQPQLGAGNGIITGTEHSTMEENVLYTIQLIQHAKLVEQLIIYAKSGGLPRDGRPTPKDLKPCPPMPYKSESVREKRSKGIFPVHHEDSRCTSFTLGEPIYIPDIGNEISKEILYKCVATIVAHAGFDTAMQMSLQTLTDVAESYLRKFINSLRRAVDKEAIVGNASGFPDGMERAFHEMGIGSMFSVHDFYQKRILQYRDKCEEKSLQLIQSYQALLPSPMRGTEGVVKFKSEMDSEEDIPELHFPATAEGGCEGALQSSLEPGFQMLQSLEQEVGIKYET